MTIAERTKAARRAELERAIGEGEQTLANLEIALPIAAADVDQALSEYEAAKAHWFAEVRKRDDSWSRGGDPLGAEQAVTLAEEPLQQARSTHTRLNSQRSQLLGLLRSWRGELESLAIVPSEHKLPWGKRLGAVWHPTATR